MALLKTALVLALAVFTATTSDLQPRKQSHVTVPLTQHLEGHGTPAGLWFGSFDVGESKDLSLLIDTCCTYVAINSRLYKPSAQSRHLRSEGQINYKVGEFTYDAVYSEEVSVQNLVSTNQTFASMTKWDSWVSTATKFEPQGVVGFSGWRANDSKLGGAPFFQKLCNEGVVEQCRFGLALGTDGKGNQILGGVDRSLRKGKFTRARLNQDRNQWTINGTLAVNNAPLVRTRCAPTDHSCLLKHPQLGEATGMDQIMVLDSGTQNVFSPIDVVRALFEHAGIRAVDDVLADGVGLVGLYPCDSPPQVGFQIGGEAKSIFNFESSAFQESKVKGKNNLCTATILGMDWARLGITEAPLWVVGQSWFQGKYLDFNAEKGTVGVAHLAQHPKMKRDMDAL